MLLILCYTFCGFVENPAFRRIRNPSIVLPPLLGFFMLPIYSGKLLSSGSLSQSTWSLLLFIVKAPLTNGIVLGTSNVNSLSPQRGTEEQLVTKVTTPKNNSAFKNMFPPSVVKLDIIPYPARNAIGRNPFLIPTIFIKSVFRVPTARFNCPRKEITSINVPKQHVVIADNLTVDYHN